MDNEVWEHILLVSAEGLASSTAAIHLHSLLPCLDFLIFHYFHLAFDPSKGLIVLFLFSILLLCILFLLPFLVLVSLGSLPSGLLFRELANCPN